MEVELRKRFQIEAAHRLPHLPADHKCARLHGHSFQITLTLRGPVNDALGWHLDYADISKAFEPLYQKLDHHYLNEVPGLENPTSENLAKWVWDALKKSLPTLAEVSVAETCNSECAYRGL